MNDRDTQFQGFAHALWMELLYACDSKIVGNSLVKVPPTKEVAESIIARYAYDLVDHVVKLVPSMIAAFPDAQSTDEITPHIPDMTTFPEAQ